MPSTAAEKSHASKNQTRDGVTYDELSAIAADLDTRLSVKRHPSITNMSEVVITVGGHAVRAGGIDDSDMSSIVQSDASGRSGLVRRAIEKTISTAAAKINPDAASLNLSKQTDIVAERNEALRFGNLSKMAAGIDPRLSIQPHPQIINAQELVVRHAGQDFVIAQINLDAIFETGTPAQFKRAVTSAVQSTIDEAIAKMDPMLVDLNNLKKVNVIAERKELFTYDRLSKLASELDPRLSIEQHPKIINVSQLVINHAGKSIARFNVDLDAIFSAQNNTEIERSVHAATRLAIEREAVVLDANLARRGVTEQVTELAKAQLALN